MPKRKDTDPVKDKKDTKGKKSKHIEEEEVPKYDEEKLAVLFSLLGKDNSSMTLAEFNAAKADLTTHLQKCAQSIQPGKKLSCEAFVKFMTTDSPSGKSVSKGWKVTLVKEKWMDERFKMRVSPNGKLGTEEREVNVFYDDDLGSQQDYQITLAEATEEEKTHANYSGNAVSIHCGKRQPVVVGYEEEGEIKLQFTTHGPSVCFNVVDVSGKKVQNRMPLA